MFSPPLSEGELLMNGWVTFPSQSDGHDVYVRIDRISHMAPVAKDATKIYFGTDYGVLVKGAIHDVYAKIRTAK
jgi:hypothetical protein